MASPEYHRIREIIASRRVSSDRPVNLEKFRANIEATARDLPVEVNGTMVDAGGVPAELQVTQDAAKEKLIINFHLSKLFFVILAFINSKGIFFLLICEIKFGQISESIKIDKFGFQWSRNLFVQTEISKGKN